MHLIAEDFMRYRMTITTFFDAIDQTAELKMLVAPAHHWANTLMRARGMTAWDLDDVKKVDLDLWSEISLLDSQIEHQDQIIKRLEENQVPQMKAALLSIATVSCAIARAQLGADAAAGDVICAAFLGSAIVRSERIDALPFEDSMRLLVDIVHRSRANEICVDVQTDDVFAALCPSTITDSVMLRNALAAVGVAANGQALPITMLRSGIADESPRTLLC